MFSAHRLHIVIYSELMPFGGGRETWMQYFLPHVLPMFRETYLYALKREDEETPNLVGNLALNVFENYTKTVSVSEFIKHTKKRLAEHLESSDFCLMIGSVVEGLLSPWLKRRFKDVKRVIWIRSIAAHEVADRHGKYLYPFIRFLELRNLSTADLTITNGADTYRYYSRHVRKRIIAIPNAVEFERYSAEKDWDARIAKFIFLGRFDPVKGGNIALDSFQSFLSQYPTLSPFAEFHIWGKGILEGEPLPERVYYHGAADRSEVPEILKNSCFEFFLSNPNEKGAGGLSHSVLEGMSSGCVGIATDIPAYRQILNDDNSIIIRDQTVDKVARVIAEIAASARDGKMNAYKSKSIRAREAASHYSVQRHVERFLDALREI